MIENGAGLRWARAQLGWSELEMADALGLGGSERKARAYVHDMETDKRPVTGPVRRLVQAYLDGWRPAS